MEKALKKAIGGGYEGYLVKQGRTFNETEINTLANLFKPYKEVHLLNPVFWQALGKAEGWEHPESTPYDYSLNSWLGMWHGFITHIAEGGTVDDFFNNLIK